MVNDGEIAKIKNFVYQKDVATFTFIEGSILFQKPIDGRPTAAIFVGDGLLHIDIPSPVERIYLADNEAESWRLVILDKVALDPLAGFLDVWSPNFLPWNVLNDDNNPGTRRVAFDRHRKEGCNNLFFDGHADWLYSRDNTTYYWAGARVR